MNKSYKTIWNESLGAWVAASELATGRGKSSRSRKAARAVLAAGILLQAGVMAPAVAGGLDGGSVNNNSQLAYGTNTAVFFDAPAMAIGVNTNTSGSGSIAIGFNLSNTPVGSILMGNNITLDRGSGGSVVFAPNGLPGGTTTPVVNSADSFVFINEIGKNTVTSRRQHATCPNVLSGRRLAHRLARLADHALAAHHPSHRSVPAGGRERRGQGPVHLLGRMALR